MLILCIAVILVLMLISSIPSARVLDLPELIDRWLHGGGDRLLVSGVGLLRGQMERPGVRRVSLLCLVCLLLEGYVLPELRGCVLAYLRSLHPGPLHEAWPGLMDCLEGRRSALLHVV
jgi:hypothetical protein